MVTSPVYLSRTIVAISESGLQGLTQRLAAIGLAVVNMEGDGNCLFR